MPHETDRPHRSERIARYVLIASVLFLIVSLGGSALKVRYAVESPGPVTDTLGDLDDGSELISVSGAKTYPTEGDLYFTTVRIVGGPERHINVWEWVSGHLDPDSRVVPEEQVFGDTSTADEVQELNEALMEGSQHNSIAVALRSVGEEVGQDNVVTRIGEDMPASGTLELKDEIVSVDGERFEDINDLVDAIADREVGDEVRLGIRRGGEDETVTLTTDDLGEGRAGIGVVLSATYDYPFEVRINAGRVGGPSAGMMFALAVRDRLTEGSMTGGESIAGTGTISDSGDVGPIGGIQQKLIGAEDGGADWFLAPVENCDEVVGHVPEGLEVYSVDTFEDAVTAVEGIAKGETGDLPTCEDAA